MKNDSATGRSSTLENDVMGLLNAALRHLQRDPARAAREAAEANEILLSIGPIEGRLGAYALAVSALVLDRAERVDITTTVMFDGQVVA